MYRIDNDTASVSLPVAGAIGSKPDAFFTKGNPQTATPATIVDDAWLNTVQEELCGLIEAAGITLVKGNYTQFKKAIDYLHQKNGAIYTSSSSAANTYTATLSPAPAAYTEGMGALIKFTNANTNAATINLNTIGAKDIKRLDGSALQAGDIAAGMIGFIVYNGTNFILMNSIASTASVYTGSTTAANTYTGTLTYPPIAYFEGMPVLIKFTNANTGAATINLNSLGAASMKRPDGSALQAGDIAAGMVAHLVYDGTNFQLINLNRTIKSIKKQYITSSSTYTPSTGMIECEIEMVGGGGGSAGAQSSGSSHGMGSGGASAGYLKKKFTSAEIGANASVTIGAGGTAGAANGNGGNGGSTVFDPAGTGVTLTCTGGNGGTAAQKVNGGIINGGSPGSGTNGDINITGQQGSGVTMATSGGLALGILGGGTSTPLGSAGSNLQIAENSTASIAPSGYGSAPGATFSALSQSSVTGTVGQPGAVVITEYCTQ